MNRLIKLGFPDFNSSRIRETMRRVAHTPTRMSMSACQLLIWSRRRSWKRSLCTTQLCDNRCCRVSRSHLRGEKTSFKFKSEREIRAKFLVTGATGMSGRLIIQKQIVNPNVSSSHCLILGVHFTARSSGAIRQPGRIPSSLPVNHQLTHHGAMVDGCGSVPVFGGHAGRKIPSL
jgi:hypothetical protein